MALKNTPDRFGTISRGFHWAVFILFVYQFFGANVMTRLGKAGTVFGMDSDFYYNWHKSIGLVLLVIAIARILWRRNTPLPNWHSSLTKPERKISHRLETGLYVAMFALPISGFLFVMAGGYGVKLFGVYDLPNPIGKIEPVSVIAWVTHVLLAYCALVVIAWHVGLGIKKHVYEKTGLLNRMLPFRK